MAQGYAKKDFADPGWQDWTPTYSNITVGNGTVVARYVQIGTLVVAHYVLTFGSTTSIDGTPVEVSVPVAASSNYTDLQNVTGHARHNESGGTNYLGYVRLANANTIRIQIAGANTTYVDEVNVNTTVPFTWGTGDTLTFTTIYEADESALINLGANDDHGSLSGLSDDDHTQYLNDARHDTEHDAAQMSETANQTLTSGSTTQLTFSTEEYDTDGGIVDLGNNRFVVQTAGIYDITGWVQFASNSTGARRLEIQINGSATIRQQTAASAAMAVQVQGVLNLAANDLVTFHALQNSGGNLNVTTRRASLTRIRSAP